MNAWLLPLANQMSPCFKEMLLQIPKELLGQCREIRIRAGRPLIILAHKEVFLGKNGICEEARAFTPDARHCSELLEVLCGHSLYAHEEEMRQGFLTLAHGFRVGLVGHTVVKQGEVLRLHQIGGFNIRIAREMLGVGKKILPHMLEQGRVQSTLILSPPGMGKTTMLRDCIRLLSESGLSVCVSDERGEIAALYKGIPQLCVGPRTDVLDGCPKSIALPMLLRSMAPQVIATDEIGMPGEVAVLQEIANAGVALLATAHAGSYQEALQKIELSHALSFFPCVVVLGKQPGNIVGIYQNGKKLSTTDFR